MQMRLLRPDSAQLVAYALFASFLLFPFTALYMRQSQAVMTSLEMGLPSEHTPDDVVQLSMMRGMAGKLCDV